MQAHQQQPPFLDFIDLTGISTSDEESINDTASDTVSVEESTDPASPTSDHDQDSNNQQPTYDILISIDVGQKNMGIAIFGCENKKLVRLMLHDLKVADKFAAASVCKATQSLVGDLFSNFIQPDQTVLVLLEHQMKYSAYGKFNASVALKNNVVATSLVSAFMHRGVTTVEVPAKNIKKRFKINSKVYKQKKDAAILCCTEILEEWQRAGVVDDQAWKQFRSEEKCDDMADAFLQGLYCLETHPKQ